MTVGGERVDVSGFDIDREDTHALNGVNEIKTGVLMAELANGFEIDAKAAEVVDEADGEEACARNGGGDCFEGIVDGEPGDLDAELFETKPGIVIGRKFFFEGNDSIAGFPGKALGDDGNAFGGVFDDGDFFGRGVDEARRGVAEAGVGIHPLVVMERAELAGIVGEPANGVGGTAAKWGDCGVV